MTRARKDTCARDILKTPLLIYWLLLSTTSASSNFVVAVDIPTDRNPDYWVSMGAAMLCALAD